MKKVLIIFTLIISSHLLTAQENCENEETNLIDLNTINKCAAITTVKENLKTTRHLASRKTSSRIRFLKIKTKNTTTLKNKETEVTVESLNQ